MQELVRERYDSFGRQRAVAGCCLEPRRSFRYGHISIAPVKESVNQKDMFIGTLQGVV